MPVSEAMTADLAFSSCDSSRCLLPIRRGDILYHSVTAMVGAGVSNNGIARVEGKALVHAATVVTQATAAARAGASLLTSVLCRSWKRPLHAHNPYLCPQTAPALCCCPFRCWACLLLLHTWAGLVASSSWSSPSGSGEAAAAFIEALVEAHDEVASRTLHNHSRFLCQCLMPMP
jgi:hypothetical protein